MEKNSKAFSGYQWTYFSSLQEDPIRLRSESFIAFVNWPALLERASKKRKGTSCILLPDIGIGYNHMVRIVQFIDGARWVARLRLPPLARADSYKDVLETVEKIEFNTISLLRQRSSVPILKIHGFEARNDCDMKVQLATVQFPKIGTIVSINEDSTYQQGPIPGLGGPFDTASEFFQVWAAKTKFGITDEQLRTASGKYADEIVLSISSFPKSIGDLADQLSVCDHGPFSLCDGDFGHNNTIVDDRYHILGVIDWEVAFAAPWDIFSDFPLAFQQSHLLSMPRGTTTRTAVLRAPTSDNNLQTRKST
ncbi:hypothetical protein M501DRAFT_1030903 [Patellaria atrata CBS 101060]|uniref:Aminoglycoside phosphotransferase domain-containing protein n=1 Tax=Patellaria atrata CBS 101060 TaxID=1346257 RepID=A0A9P4VTM2_9PEZI|nr:hypothetical protein M501DRAFT_1030903 [Patellaria atrata CBS 101060]